MRKKVLVIAHDAGAANLIAAYIKKHLIKEKVHACVAGPAARIFRRERIPFSHVPHTRTGIARLVKQHRDADIVLIGAWWHTRIESMALHEAKKIGLKTVVYLDSWTNYRERFDYPKRGWRDHLPDEFWVGDRYARSLAKKLFPKRTRITLVPNEYFVAAIHHYKKLRRSVPQDRVLFASNFSRHTANTLQWVLQTLVARKESSKVLIRLHPSDDHAWYASLRKHYRGHVRIEISSNADIVRDLVRAKVVVGPETVALAVAALCGIPSIRVLHKKEKPMLPFKHIKVVRSVSALQRVL